MKIIHVIGSLDQSAGGPSRSVPQTCIELNKLGVEIEIITRPSKNPVFIQQNETLKVHFLSLIELKQWVKQLDKTTVDLIHLQHVWDPYIHVMAYFARTKGIPYIITPRGMLEPWIMAQRPWKKKLGLWLYQRKDLERAAYLHATCEMEKEHIRALGFKNPIVVIPNGIDTSAVPAVKQRYGTKRMVFLSRVHQKKGIELLIDAWKQAAPVGWQLLIAGEGKAEYIHSLLQRIKEYNISTIQLVGGKYGNEKWDFLQSADIMVLPTYSENFGIVIAEALATGLPVITTTGTPWQELEANRCGWWIDLSVDNLAKAITDATTKDANKLKEMGLRGRKLVEEKYDIKAVVHNVKTLYDWILRDTPESEFIAINTWKQN